MTVTGSGSEVWRRRAFVVWTLIGWLILAGGAVWMFGRVWGALVPFILALVAVFLFRAPVGWLQARGFARSWAVALCFASGLVVLGVAGAFVLPPVGGEISALARRFPGYLDSAMGSWHSLQASYDALSLPRPVLDAMQQLQLEVEKAAPRISSAFARGAVAAGGQALGMMFNVVIGLVIAFWVLKDLPTIREEILVLSGPARREEVRTLLSETSSVLGGYLRAQAVISTLTGGIVVIVLGLIGVPYSVVLGLLAGVLNVVPYLGPAIAALVAAVVAGVATQNAWMGVAAVAVIIGAQQLIDLTVGPKVMSRQVDLHPLLVLLSLLAGGTLFGAAGMLLAIPVVAVGKAFFVHFYEKHTKVELESEQGALFRATGPPRGRCEPRRVDETEETEES